jgi:hypothetical protein
LEGRAPRAPAFLTKRNELEGSAKLMLVISIQEMRLTYRLPGA